MLVVSKVGKAYKRYPSQWARFKEFAVPFVGNLHNLSWVLSDISFDLRAGEALGVVGMNGAGKSTLLKLIAGVSRPTTGSIKINGSVTALLELGLGFDPAYTGRENALLVAQLMGMSQIEVKARMGLIEEFAEIGKYFDEPLRTYSSGMQLRLAFSITTVCPPDLLVVDEALSVGDAYFQHKCFSRIREFKENGTAVLMVSHDKSAILSLCERAILLDGGHMIDHGPAEHVINLFNSRLAAVSPAAARDAKDIFVGSSAFSGTGQVRIEEAALLDEGHSNIREVKVGQYAYILVRARSFELISGLVMGFSIRDRFGQVIFGTNTWHMGAVIETVKPGEEIKFLVGMKLNLGEGFYSVSLALHQNDTHIDKNFEWRDMAITFEVSGKMVEKFEGSSYLAPEIKISRVGS